MKYIFGNWKLYLTDEQSGALAQSLSALTFDTDQLSVAVFPSALSFSRVTDTLSESEIVVGAQNVGYTPLGAYTGEVSAHVFAQAGATHALVGHSERRHIFGEDTDATVKKMQACLDEGITPVLCIGETKEDVEENKIEYRLRRQLIPVLEGVNGVREKKWVIAYEPVWAISTGGNGTPCPAVDALERHTLIRTICSEFGVENVPVLYGGSVNVGNVEEYVTTPGIDGVLVGHASVDGTEFAVMVEKMSQVV
jgi:triosephosphate isomerase (TIM)